MTETDGSRLELELGLLQAMYPDQIDYNARSRDLKYLDQPATLHLRLPERYPESGFPDVLSATSSSKEDLRNRTKAAIQDLGLAAGEEALDAIIACFQAIIAETNADDLPTAADSTATSEVVDADKTVIIWLHHLLALSKRKLAIAPPPLVSGITKPGYPGIMLFTGPASAVHDHLNTLKAENWQAFQVRYEGDELWQFAHGAGVQEVETMAEIVEVIQAGEHGDRRKEEFLKAVGIK
ncbi:hypothetical protein BDV96DRAFT_617330 [Lophiotrema nucula]|uniref:RWD domain-containing protein n=1 Tax=Lophiotrema nucula TaxID=690887 RepID=A0A6A5YI96_9PLEO|nr:hypothetical protein BDV96DRAFT_617330 [Lophiotrema nucula]